MSCETSPLNGAVIATAPYASDTVERTADIVEDAVPISPARAVSDHARRVPDLSHAGRYATHPNVYGTVVIAHVDDFVDGDELADDVAATEIVGGACSNAGQVCNSVEQVLVDETVEDELIDALVEAAESLTVGDPFDDETGIAAMIDDVQFETVVDLFERTVEGAAVEYSGNYGGVLGQRVFEPTILSSVTPNMSAAE